MSGGFLNTPISGELAASQRHLFLEHVFVIHLASATFGVADPAATAQVIDGEWHERLAVDNIGESRSCLHWTSLKARTCDAEL
jgi:hypothetical protein